VGSIIVKHRKVAMPDIPTDDLSLDEVGQQLVEKNTFLNLKLIFQIFHLM